MERSATHGVFHKDEKLYNLLIVRVLCFMIYYVSLLLFCLMIYARVDDDQWNIMVAAVCISIFFVKS